MGHMRGWWTLLKIRHLQGNLDFIAEFAYSFVYTYSSGGFCWNLSGMSRKTTLI
jgi:hypothetical protein